MSIDCGGGRGVRSSGMHFYPSRALTCLLALADLLACTGRARDQSADAINRPFTINGVAIEPDSLNAYLVAHRGFTSRGGEMGCAYVPLGQERTRVFVWALCGEHVAVDGQLYDGSGMSLAAAFEIGIDSGRPRIVGVEVPQDGDRYAPSVRRIFPESIWPQIFDANDRYRKRGVALGNYLRAEAAARLGITVTRGQ